MSTPLPMHRSDAQSRNAPELAEITREQIVTIPKSSGRDLEVVSTNRGALCSELCPQVCVDAGDPKIERQGWDELKNRLDECLSTDPSFGSVGTQNASEQLGGSHTCQRCFLAGNQRENLPRREPPPLHIDKDAGVDQDGHSGQSIVGCSA